MYACVLGQQAQGGVKAEMWMGQVPLLGCHPLGCRQLGLSPPLVQGQHRVLGWSSSMQRGGDRAQGQ